MERDEILKILKDNRDNIENQNWEKVYETIPADERGQFSDFLIQTGIDQNTLFKKYIPALAYYASEELESIELPKTVTKIDDRSFKICKSLVSIYLPNTLKYIGPCAFDGCTSLLYITYDGTQSEWDNIYKGVYWSDGCPAKITFLR